MTTTIITGGTGYSEPTGSWGGSPGAERYTNSGPATAAFAFTGLTPGTAYEIGFTWNAGGNRVHNTAWSVAGTSGSPSGTIDQQVAPSGPSDPSSQYKILGSFTPTGTTLTLTIAYPASPNPGGNYTEIVGAYLDTAKTHFLASDAGICWGGQFADGTFSRPARQASSPGVQADAVVTGTACDLAYYCNGTGGITITVDGTTTTPTLTANAWSILPVFSGLPDTTHRVTIKYADNSILWWDLENFLAVTGSAPTVALPAGYTNTQTLCSTSSAVQSDGSLEVSTATGPSTLRGDHGSFRFKATATGFAVWMHCGGDTIRVLVDDDPAMGTLHSPPSTGNYEWVFVTGLDGGAEHQYTVMCGGPASARDLVQTYFYALMPSSGTINQAALAARDTWAFYGDSITANLTTDFGLTYAEIFCVARKLGCISLGVSGRTAKGWAISTNGELATATVTGLSPAPVALVIELGVNDADQVYGTESAGDFGSAYQNMLQLLIDGLPPATPIYPLDMFPAASGPSGRSSFLAAQRSAIAACTSNSACIPLATDTWVNTTTGLFDGLHPNAAGYADIAAHLLAATAPPAASSSPSLLLAC